ncbi:hypothetical protein ACJWDR_28960 [Streptomyces tauricus]|uniref:hypothetical protein n=1 Tax=Streptomyces tauricus TaxID=68274 RepID=UPI00387EF5C1
MGKIQFTGWTRNEQPFHGDITADTPEDAALMVDDALTESGNGSALAVKIDGTDYFPTVIRNQR